MAVILCIGLMSLALIQSVYFATLASFFFRFFALDTTPCKNRSVDGPEGIYYISATYSQSRI